MSPRLLASVARSVDTPRALIPHMSDLFAGLDSLGSSPRMVVGALRRAGLGEGNRILDLACGKGAAAVAAAQSLRCRVLGIDAYPPFLAAATHLARRKDVADMCEWRHADARGTIRGRFDAAMMIGLDSLAIAAPRLRRLVGPGGVYIIDDVVAMRGAWAQDPVTDGVPLLAEALAFLDDLGDEAIEARPVTAAWSKNLNAQINAALARSAAAISGKHPRLRPELERFRQRQREAGELLSGPFRAVLFVVRKGRSITSPRRRPATPAASPAKRPS